MTTTIDRRGVITGLMTAHAKADAASVHDLRHCMAAVLIRAGLAKLVDTATLLAAELLSNAVLHAPAPDGGHPGVCLRVWREHQRLLVEVADPDPLLPHPRHPQPDEEHGRGLALVEALATAWGERLHADGK